MCNLEEIWTFYLIAQLCPAARCSACVQVLLEAGADPTARTLALRTPLHLAAKRGSEASARLLLEYGALVNASAKKTTPLHEVRISCARNTPLPCRCQIFPTFRRRQGVDIQMSLNF